MRHKDDLAAEVLVEVIGTATDCSKIDGTVIHAQRLQLSMRAKV
jgi:hypothetical protein